ncbi:retron St85 family RNA-directed DNA polymerase [Idiomarina loihiensis]|uniref:retron St85 family RNA-directed DNA polymerase n=1 Tax=Idiomarina loihiensis TaxID=135577 RepID=UPI003158AFCE
MQNFFDVLAKRLGVGSTELKTYLSTAHHRYKVFEIPKRGGKGTRVIAQPAKTLKIIQRNALEMLELEGSVSSNAMAYRLGVSIKNNAEAHLNSNYLLKMDFKDFFPSIKPEDLTSRLNFEELGFGFDEVTSRLLPRVFFWLKNRNGELQLSVGAPSSPLISNFVMLQFDNEVNSYCKEYGVAYTRYADDLAFSTSEPERLYEVEKLIQKIANDSVSPRLEINRKKTIHTSRKHNRHVTGVTLSAENKLSLGRSKKREISSLVFKYKTKTITDIDSVNELKGWLSHANNIEPEFLARLSKKYGEEVITELIKV